ncbi:gamma-interferon-inducible lysosomal thiol reductase-like [Anthonomus grandis grandis]|uniref:gamma-interferon-inducible lysosomal thiol reductase-like n=1 Tax=Anthonomus grandis grandis TaxID=2921223 RepID=UPI0021656213|nr:gamma-interferon-inducible lysosomal thiol reductase-like [Anthonomus grandis grandis]
MYALIFLFFLSVAAGKSVQVQDSVQVQVYYESLCPDSIAFIVNQLYPAFYTIGSEKILLELVPWGHASETVVNGSKTFKCQHGAQECYGNKIHSCAIDLYDVNVSTAFIFCSERSDSPADDADLQKCAESVDGVLWSEIQECITSGKGDELLWENGKKTALIDPGWVPTIVIDGSYSDDNQNAAETEFKSFICDLLGNPTPACLC